jgi:phosphoribosylformylglycinamidine synthase
LIGEDFEELGGSEYLKVIYNKVAGESPKLDLQKEKRLHDAVLMLINNGLINSAHDVSEGGIVCALAECCIINEKSQIGGIVNIPVKTREDFSLFSESQSRIIVSVSSNNKAEFEKLLKTKDQIYYLLGETGSDCLTINNKISIKLFELSNIYFNTIPGFMNG